MRGRSSVGISPRALPGNGRFSGLRQVTNTRLPATAPTRPPPPSRRRPPLPGVAARRGPEHAGVVAGEVGGTLVADREGGAGGAMALVQHQAARFEEPQVFLELQGRQGRHGLEVLVEVGASGLGQGSG
jgi:hypothetical protein